MTNRDQLLLGSIWNKKKEPECCPCPPISTEEGNIIECMGDGLFASAVSAGLISDANQGLTVDSTDVRLGQTYNQAGDPAMLLTPREVPLGGSTFRFRSISDQTWQVNSNGSISYTDTTNTNSIVYNATVNRIGTARFQFTNTAVSNSAAIYQSINDLGKLAGFGINSSSVNPTVGEPGDCAKIATNTANGIFLSSQSATGSIAFCVGATSLNSIRTVLNAAGNFLIGTFNTITPTDNGAKLQVGGNATFSGNIRVGGVAEYADNAAALVGGLVTGDIYRTGDDLKIVH